jgi:hypothetical protein
MTATHRMLSTFDIKASPLTLSADAKPDELMIDWTALPTASRAAVYLPSVTADWIVAMATSLYGSQPFTKIDAHTVSCEARGISYMPIAQAGGNLAGLIDVELSNAVKVGEKLSVIVKQLTAARAEIVTGGNRSPVAGTPLGRERISQITWRKVLGVFQLALKVADKVETLRSTQRNLALLRWIFAAIPPTDRWYPVFSRYLGALATQITALGGNANAILPSAYGMFPGDHIGCGDGSSGKEHRRWHRMSPWDDALSVVGKIQGLIYDHFGDFEGFILEADDGQRFHFFSRERYLEEVVQRAWATRLRVTVVPEDEDEQHLRRIVLHPTPTPL